MTASQVQQAVQVRRAYEDAAQGDGTRVLVGALAHLRELASGRGVTLLTATRQPEISEADARRFLAASPAAC